MCLLLTFFSACNNNESATNLQSPLKTYSVENSYSWTDINTNSIFLSGKCSIVGNNIIYTKIDDDFNGQDECRWDADTGANPGCTRLYIIDFGSSNPQLIPSDMCS